MDATGGQATDRTRDLRERRSQNQSEQMALDLEIFQKHMGWERKQRGKHGLFLQGERIGIPSHSFLIIPPLGRFTEIAPEPNRNRNLQMNTYVHLAYDDLSQKWHQYQEEKSHAQRSPRTSGSSSAVHARSEDILGPPSG